MKDYWVLLGSFGSGKSELGLNLAVQKAGDGPCTVVDLDVINPYFRISERGDVLEPAGVELIMPPFALEKSPGLFRLRARGGHGALRHRRRRRGLHCPGPVQAPV